MKTRTIPTLEQIDAEWRRREVAKGTRKQVQAYRDDPDRFVQECFLWDPGEHPFAYQLEGLRRLVSKRRVAIRSPHSAGKTCVAAWAILWFSLTRDMAGDDWKVPTTASVARQLQEYLWPEVAKWARKLNWLRIGREPFTPMELQTQALDLSVGRAFALSSDDPGRMEGAHAKQLLYVFDEAKMIESRTWDAIEGAFAGRDYCLALAISTPGEPVGRFYEIQSKKAGYEDWDAMHITIDDMIAAGRQDPAWVAQREKQWGRTSAVFQNRVLGEFAVQEATGVIPLSWVEAANQRWLEWRERLTAESVVPLTTIGLDVARSGEDRSVAALRSEWVVTEFRYPHDQTDTMSTTGLLTGILQHARSALAVVDVIGLGAGVVDRLRELNFRVLAFNAAARAMIGEDPAMDRTGELGFVNLRSAAWWYFRELLDPTYGIPIALPPPGEPGGDELIGELTAPHYRVVSGGKIEVESKDRVMPAEGDGQANRQTLRQRLGRSTDHADAVIQAFADHFQEHGGGDARIWGGVSPAA